MASRSPSSFFSAATDNLRLAFGTFLGNPLRSLLTLLGIVIGVTTVITMMALIEGLRLKVNSDLSQLGANTFQVSKWPSGFGRVDWRMYSKRKNLTLEDMRAIQQYCPSVGSVSANDTEGAQRISTATLETRPSVRVTGATAEYVETGGLSVAVGRFFGQVDVVDGRQVAVLGLDVVEALFPGMDPIGQQLRIKGRPFTVVGVLQRRGSFLGMVSMDNVVFIPLPAYEGLYGANNSYNLSVQATSPELFSKARRDWAPSARSAGGMCALTHARSLRSWRSGCFLHARQGQLLSRPCRCGTTQGRGRPAASLWPEGMSRLAQRAPSAAGCKARATLRLRLGPCAAGATVGHEH